MNSLELFSTIALITTNNYDFSTQMEYILKEIGKNTHLSRVYIFIENEDETISNKFEWVNDGIESLKDKYQNFSCENYQYFKKILYRDGNISSNHIDDLPEKLRNFLKEQAILAILICPITIDGEIKGFIGFHECKNKKKWNETELNILLTVSGVISNLYEKHMIFERVREDKKNLSILFNTIDDFIVIGDLNGKILYANNSVIEKLGYNNDELCEMEMLDLRSKEKRAEAKEILNNISKGKTDKCIIPFETKKGENIPSETRFWFGKWNNIDCIFSISKNLSKEQEIIQRFTKLFDYNPILMSVSSFPDRVFQDVNKSFTEKLGYSYEEVIGKREVEIGLLYDENEREKLVSAIQKSEEVKGLELKIKTKNNELIEGIFYGKVIEVNDNSYFLIVVLDVTELKNVQKLYQREKNRLETIINSTQLGTWEWNIETGKTIFNERWAEIIGYKLSELDPVDINTWTKLTHPDDLKEASKLLEMHFKKQTEFYECEFRMKHKDGHWVWIHDKGKVEIWDQNDNPILMYGTHVDITHQKNVEEMMLDISNHDALTGVYNRRYIFNRLEKDIERYYRKEVFFSIAILDIDHFKRINDNYGHLAGDYILKSFTETISENLREYDLLGRFGGEEFIIILYDVDKEEAKEIIERIATIIRDKVFTYQDKNIKFTFSGGVSSVLEEDSERIRIEELISVADKRLYKAKDAGRDKIFAQ